MSVSHQAYRGRNNKKTELNESKYIGMAMLSIFQSFFFGVPLIFISATDRPADDLLSRSDEYLFCSLYTDPSVHFFAKDSEAERY